MNLDKTTINGKEVTLVDLTKRFTSHGVRKERFQDIGEGGSLPTGEKITIVDVKEGGEKGTDFAHVRIVAKDSKGELHDVSLNRFLAAGVLRESKDQMLTPNQVVKNGWRFFATGDMFNKLPRNQGRAIIALLNKEIEVEEIEHLAIGFQADDTEEHLKYQSKEQAISNGQVVRRAYKIVKGLN
jgi:hypothetical protein